MTSYTPPDWDEVERQKTQEMLAGACHSSGIEAILERAKKETLKEMISKATNIEDVKDVLRRMI